jgi:hypothetical protein
MSRFYAVELKTIAIIQIDGDTEDASDAEFRADEMQSDILRDARDNSMEVNCIGAVKTLAELKEHGWDGECLPYGGDGNTRLKDLLPITAKDAA